MAVMPATYFDQPPEVLTSPSRGTLVHHNPNTTNTLAEAKSADPGASYCTVLTRVLISYDVAGAGVLTVVQRNTADNADDSTLLTHFVTGSGLGPLDIGVKGAAGKKLAVRLSALAGAKGTVSAWFDTEK